MISVIMVNYFSDQMITNSISKLEHANLEILIVDNSSTFSPDIATERISILRPGKNLGFGRAVNSALGQCQGDVIILLNPDVNIELKSILGIVDFLVSDEEYGIVAPLLEEKQHRGPFLNGGYWPTLSRMLMHLSFCSRFSQNSKVLRGLFAHQYSKPSRDLIELDWVSGACLAIRREDFELIGGFNERWFMYCEDMELSFRIRNLGKKIGIFPSSIGQHLGGSSDGRNEKVPEVNTLWLTNLAQFYKTFFSHNNQIRVILWIEIGIIGYGLRWLYSVLRYSSDSGSGLRNKHESEKNFAYVRALQRALIDEVKSFR